MDPELRYRLLVDEIAAEFPRFRLLRKPESVLQRSIARLLAVVTLGGQRHYMTHFVTTLGARVYVPADWDARPADERWLTLRHERVHLRQFRRWGFIAMAVAYVSFPLPLGLAWGRMRIERAAYEETIRAAAALHGKAYVCTAAFRGYVVEQFLTGAYGWMWPFRGAMERWYDRVLASL